METYFPLLSEPARRWLRLAGLLVAAALLLWLTHALRGVLTPIAAGLAIAYVLNPLVRRLERRGVQRWASVSAGLVLLLGTAGVLLLAAAIQAAELAAQLPEYFARAVAWLRATFPNLLPGETPAEGETPGVSGGLASAALVELARRHGLTLAEAAALNVPALLGQVGRWLMLIVLVPIYAFCFMLYFDRIVAAARDHLPQRVRPAVVRIVTMIDEAVAEFFRGRLVIAAAVGAICGVGWYLVGVPYSLAFGAVTAVLQLVPVIGVLVLPPALILTYLEHPDAWFWPVTLAFGVYMLSQAIENFLLAPYIYAQSSGLHPVTSIVALLAGNELAGLLGMLLAIPLAGTLKSLAQEYLMPAVRRLAGIPEPTRAPPPQPYAVAAQCGPVRAETAPPEEPDSPPPPTVRP